MNLKLPDWTKKIPTKQVKKVLSTIGKALLTVGLVLVITGCIVACVLTVYVATNFNGMDSLPDVDLINQNQTSVVMVYDEDAKQYVDFQRLDGIKREWIPYDEIPLNMINAVIAIEDERFLTHYGVDWKRTISAVANLVLHFNDTEFGGSTLTQQLIKVSTGNDEHSISRKITEIFSAIEMEKYYSKEEILQAYLNILPLGNDVEGVGAAAKYYFGVDASELSLAQCAALASITQNPSKFNPYRRPNNLRTRQRTVLWKMFELGFINADEYQQALGEELIFKNTFRTNSVYDYYTDMLIDDVVSDLMEQHGYTKAQANNLVFYGGLTIYSCEDPALQKKAEAIYADDKNFPAVIPTDEKQPQAAIYVMDYTGKCVAVVGGRGEKTANRVLNRATQSLRQPGSAMKPIATYASAVQMNLINFSSPVRDCFITLTDGTKWPKNYGQSTPRDSGMTVVDIAVQTSMNTVPAQLMQTITPQRAFDYLTGALKISSLVTADEKGNTDIAYAPMTLGGLTNGVYLREITAAYQMFGNGGYYNEPYSYTKVQRGNDTLLDNTGNQPIRVLDEDSAYVMNRLLQHVVTGNHTATARQLKGSWSQWEVFAKTGTTQENNDVWLVGGTPKYLAASWFGYDENQELTSRQTSAAKNSWNAVMLALHAGLEPTTFMAKGDTVEATFCYASGGLATDACTSTGTGVYKPDQLPPVCTQHPSANGPVTNPNTPTTPSAGESTATATGEQAPTTSGSESTASTSTVG